MDCKIAPDVLARILQQDAELDSTVTFPNLVVGHQSRDDAAQSNSMKQLRGVIDDRFLLNEIVDDPYQFGRIAATNAISDIYAMGGTPIMAIAILGWPWQNCRLKSQTVSFRGRDVCAALGFPLAGAISIDAPEPIFGLAVTGIALREHLKQNDAAHAGDNLILTKPLGIGITPQRKSKAACNLNVPAWRLTSCQPENDIGAELATVSGVHAMTDVTGFGLAGHLLEMCQGAGLTALLDGAGAC